MRRTIGPLLVALILVSALVAPPQPASAFQTSGTATQWWWQNPLPNGNSLDTVSCTSTTSCVFGGLAGTILTTSDGGATWASQNPGTNAYINGLSCPSATVCIADGYPDQAPNQGVGVIVASNDGGKTWTQQNALGVIGLQGNACPSTTTCFIGAQNGVILSTTNGGTTWTTHTAGAGIWSEVSCPSTTTCFIAGTSGIDGTIDGGTTWTPQNLPPSVTVRGISCPTVTVCFASGGTGTILKTSDGGGTWTAQTTTGTTSDLATVSCPSTSVCFAAGANDTIIATTNGGISWSTQFQRTFYYGWYALSCPSVSACFAVGNHDILGTTNGGTTWTQLSIGPSQTAEFYAISCPSLAVCYATGYGGLIMTTVDGGNRWTQVTNSGTPYTLRAISCPSVTTCFAVGENQAAVATTDGGLSWTPQTVPNTLSLLSAVSCGSVTNCVVAAGNTILRTSDGGKTWTGQSFPYSFVGASCPNVSTCYVLTNVEYVFITTDGGNSWTVTDTGPAMSILNAISCIGTNWCVVVGTPPNISAPAPIYQTSNFGATWTARTSTTTDTLGSVGCTAGGGLCVAAGFNGHIVRSNDLGQTWASQISGTEWPLFGVFCRLGPSCWIVGLFGTILWNKGPVSDIASTVVASPATVPNDGTTTSTVTVTLLGGVPIPGKTVTLTQSAGPGTATIIPASAVSDASGRATFTVSSTTVGADTFTARDTTDNIQLIQQATVTFGNLVTAVGTSQYTLVNSDGATWKDMDPLNLSMQLTPWVDSDVIINGNVDLWTATAGVNQDVGIAVSGGGVYPTNAGQPEAWKESGGFAGTFSPNAASVQTVVRMSAGTTYSVKLQWKANKAVAGSMIFAGAGPISGLYSPTRLTALMVPHSTGVPSATSRKQYTLTGSNGSTWVDIDATNLQLSYTPTANGVAVVSGNVDLWTAYAGLNQDIGIAVNGSVASWKESGGFAGTFSPNAAFVQGAVSMTAGTPYTIKLQWKTNKNAGTGTIVAGAGPIGTLFSPTSLGLQFFPSGMGLTDKATNKQYSLTSNDGVTWTDMDAIGLSGSMSSASACLAVLSGNADLWTANAGYNQDIAVTVNGTVAAWKESGGFAGTFSPNAAYVQTVFALQPSTTYTVKLQWKTNKLATGATIFTAAGSAGAFSPTRLTIQLVGCS